MTQENAQMVQSRRSLVRTRPASVTSHDYLIDLKIKLTPDYGSNPLSLLLRYVPDRDLLRNNAMREYWRFVEATEWAAESELALAILEDLNNELIPRWLQVQIRDDNLSDYVQGVMITVEDRQPGWHNQYLLSRIGQVVF